MIEFDELDDVFEENPEEAKKTQEAIDQVMNSNTLLEQIEGLSYIAHGCKLTDQFFDDMKDCIHIVADKLQLTPMQTILLLPFINDPDDTVSRRDLSHFFNCSAPKMLAMDSELTGLVRRRYLSRGRNFRGDGLCLSDIARKALSGNKALPVINIDGLMPLEFMDNFRHILVDCLCDHKISTEDMQDEMLTLIEENGQLGIVKALKDYQLSDDDILITLYYCKRLVYDFQRDIPLDPVSRLFEDFYSIGRAFQRGSHPLLKCGVLEPCGKDMRLKDVFRLSDEACDKLLAEYDIIDAEEEESFQNFEVIKACDIKPKAMFYSDDNQNEIDVLTDLLSGDHFNDIRNNLMENNMRPGFNCLFYGTPGTGKTETVLQLARATGRDIMKVDISSIRDMWYGNTEKMAREIFSNYAELVKKRSVTPILLFNEADALLSVRTQVNNARSTDKTENAIQNIFLEGMENLDGIMIATTNLTENLDSAFERRFIYKVRFEQPSIDAKAAIWKSFIHELTDMEAQVLASRFDFSGGQIENIARKSFVETLLFSKKPALDRIIELCNKEKLENKNQRRAMGFVA